MSPKRTAAAVLVATLSLAWPGSSAAVDFLFNYTDAPGVGFNAAGQIGADRRASLELSAGVIEGYLAAYTATILIDVNGSVTNDTTLASASSNFNLTFPGLGFGSRGDVMTKILGGADPAPLLADGQVNWNFEDFMWESYSDFQPGELDFQNTAIHELTHAIGFASDIAQNGDSAYGDPGGTPSAWSPFDQFVGDSTGSIIDGGTFALNLARWNVASVGGTGPVNGLLFNGANAVAANGGQLVSLYSPTTWNGGSSGSHLDTDFFTGANEQLLNHASSLSEGLDIRSLSAIELGILKDIGYTQVVPEPSAALLGVIGLLGMCGRRLRNTRNG
jgi:hypothetical protein